MKISDIPAGVHSAVRVELRLDIPVPMAGWRGLPPGSRGRGRGHGLPDKPLALQHRPGRLDRGRPAAPGLHSQQRGAHTLPGHLLRQVAQQLAGPGPLEPRVPLLEPLALRVPAVCLPLPRVRGLRRLQEGLYLPCVAVMSSVMS